MAHRITRPRNRYLKRYILQEISLGIWTWFCRDCHSYPSHGHGWNDRNKALYAWQSHHKSVCPGNPYNFPHVP